MGSPDHILYVLAGPTGIGKSRLAMALASRHHGEIISADSRQIYKYMDIGTAKPILSEREKIAHHLIDVFQPGETVSAGRYAALTDKAMKDIWARGKKAFLVGGSGLYIRASLKGIFEGPGRDGEVRNKLEEAADKFGAPYLYEKLKEVDLECAAKLHPNDGRRIIRALEVYTLSGKKISEWQKEIPARGFSSIYVCLYQDMAELYRRIEARVEEMLEKGLIDEVKGLVKKGFGESLVLRDTIGYREILEHLEGKLGREEAIELIKKNSRRFAKGQMSWFRGEKEIKWVEVKKGESEETFIFKVEEAFGLKEEKILAKSAV